MTTEVILKGKLVLAFIFYNKRKYCSNTYSKVIVFIRIFKNLYYQNAELNRTKSKPIVILGFKDICTLHCWVHYTKEAQFLCLSLTLIFSLGKSPDFLGLYFSIGIVRMIMFHVSVVGLNLWVPYCVQPFMHWMRQVKNQQEMM